jgi:hypothetical protein
MRRPLLLLAAALAALLAAAPAQDQDAQVREVLRGAILGNPDRARMAAQERLDLERAFRRDGIPIEPTSASMMTVAAASEARLCDIRELRRALDGYPRTDSVRRYERLLRSEEPRQRFREARADRRYERVRRTWNAIVLPISDLMSGQFFNLLAIPFEAGEYLLSGYRFASPEERRELLTARAAANTSDPAMTRKALATQERLGKKRLAVAALQARRNGEAAAAAGRREQADWWYRRELALLGRAEPFRGTHKRLGRQAQEATANRLMSLRVTDGERSITEGTEYDDYQALLRLAVTAPASAEIERALFRFRVDHPYTALLDSLDLADAARERLAGETAVARTILAAMAEEGGPRGASAAEIARRAEFSPETPFLAAKSAERARYHRFIVYGDDPYRGYLTHLNAEEARLREARWIRGARVLFLPDMLSRLLASPFLDPRPREELFDAAGAAPAKWLNEGDGRRWQRETANAMLRRRRPEEARKRFLAMGDADGAAAAARRAARNLFRDAERIAPNDPADAAATLRRLLNGYPNSPYEARGQALLERVTRLELGYLKITRPALLAYRELWDGGPLDLRPELLDGKDANGELDREGILLLRGGGYLYRDRATGEFVEIPLPESETEAVARFARPRLRDTEAEKAASRPLPRRRIPLQLQGTALPGFDIAPGLVPLQPDPALRRLYE